MAVNSLKKSCDKIQPKYSSHSSRGNTFPSNYLVKLNIATEGSSLFSTKSSKDKKNKSPYLTRDSTPFSKVIEKKILHRKAADFVTSFPLAVNLYKANSDEFKSQKNGIKKVKKSVLTLPNMPAAIPKTCTVSDMNDSEYFNKSDDDRKLRAKKRFMAQKKCKVRNKDYEFYDRDARYCSQMNINLDCSSTDIINHLNGDGKRVSKKKHSINKLQTENKFNAHDVWAVLRNINRFQFRPSPPMSEESIQMPKKKKIRSKKKNRNSTRVIETRRTEEFAYITKFEIDRKSPNSFTQSSSFDRITVIAKQDEFNEICNELEKNIVTPKASKLKKSLQSNNIHNKLPLKAVSQKEDLRSVNKNLQNFNSKLKLLSNNNVTSIVNDEHKHKNDKNQDNYKYHNLTAIRSKELCTLYSGSSKGAINIHLAKSNGKGINTDGSSKQLEVMSKDINNDHNLVPVKQNEQKRRLRLETTMPSAATMPKLTQTEIRRRLANMKFPIVILGKDQLGSNSFVVMNYEPPQFMGLENNIWPFMQEWYNQNSIKPKKPGQGNQKKSEEKLISVIEINRTSLPIDRKGNLRKVDKESPINKPAIKEKNAQNNCDHIICKKTYQKRPNPPSELTKLQQSKKPKSMHILKDKMLKLLYKKDSDNDSDNDKSNKKWHDTIDENINKPNAVTRKISKNIDASIQTVVDFKLVSPDLSNCLESVTLNPENQKLTSMSKYPWAKTKWASDFIENVVRKVRNGVYYNQENKYLFKSVHCDTKEASIQTILKGKNIDLIERVMQTDNYSALTSYVPTNCLDELLGFGEGNPLEIKTLNMKEVAVKHCTTNVIVQFDVTIPSGSRCFIPLSETTSSIIPLTITESKTMVFKCQTAILNAMLPAEICSILPKIMKSIIDSNRNVIELPCPPVTVNPISSLCTVSETGIKPIINNSITPTQITLSPIIRNLLEGTFSYKINSKPTVRIPILSFNCCNVKHLTSFFGKLPIRPYFSCNVNPYGLGLRFASRENDVSQVDPSSTCTALQVYQPHSHLHQVFEYKINTSPVECCFTSLLEQMWAQKFNIRFKISSFIFPLDVKFDSKKLVMNVTVEKVDAHGIEPLTSKSNLEVDSIYNNILSRNSKKSENSINLLSCKVIENKTVSSNNRIDKKESQIVLSHIKPRKKSFVKLYRKCKSTTNISGERSSTSLSKITNLDEFFQALGSGKLLSSVFDGQAGSKILTALMEMKSWITDISQRQAMLVLLLTNKKDTPNLVRFRPILLQGIAVNRITRASELDMEIEVIERENFNKFSQYEGVRYHPEIIENNENLLEELYWIAKTTASDYQKPFNEASEKLLKSLLAKRKKLNPSYLRVMARYVGLGLLNTSNKN